MRAAIWSSGLALGLLFGGLQGALASPLHSGGAVAPFDTPATLVQMQCDARRCIDPRTGAYTQSTCNQRGCRPLGGIVGYERPQGQPRMRQPDSRWDDPPPRRRGDYYEDGPRVNPRMMQPNSRWDEPPRRRYYDEPPRRRNWDDRY